MGRELPVVMCFYLVFYEEIGAAETDNVHKAVPADLEWPQGEEYGVDIGKSHSLSRLRRCT